MKILVLELARLGDIFQTWPALRGLRRQWPQARIEVLSRARFQPALEGLEAIDQVRILPTQEILSPLLETQMDVKTAHQRLSRVVHELQQEKYDWILNFSFSPFSSYLTHAISSESTKVSGYSRTSDGYLAIPDDMSAYVYAQVGVGRPNRYHLAEIFGTMAGVDLIESDWRPPRALKASVASPEVLIHVGASDAKKQISPVKWATILNQFQKICGVKIGLVGSAAESRIAEQIMASVPSERMVNFVGKTDMNELFSLIQGARLLVGADSAPIHMASLTGTCCVNLSLASVNFWETGPRAFGSVVLRGADETDFASDKVALVMKRALFKEKQDLSAILVQAGSPSYWFLAPKDTEFQWNFLKALYTGEDFPPNENSLFKDGIQKLADINLLMIEQMEAIQKGAEIPKVGPIIDRGEEIIETIAKLVPDLVPLVRWYQTEKVRIGPNSPEKLLESSLRVQKLLQNVLDLYLESYGLAPGGVEGISSNQEGRK